MRRRAWLYFTAGAFCGAFAALVWGISGEYERSYRV